MVSVQFRKKFSAYVILWLVGPKISNFYQIFLLIAAFKKFYCRVYCYFYVLVIKMDIEDIQSDEVATSTARNLNNS